MLAKRQREDSTSPNEEKYVIRDVNYDIHRIHNTTAKISGVGTMEDKMNLRATKPEQDSKVCFPNNHGV